MFWKPVGVQKIEPVVISTAEEEEISEVEVEEITKAEVEEILIKENTNFVPSNQGRGENTLGVTNEGRGRGNNYQGRANFNYFC